MGKILKQVNLEQEITDINDAADTDDVAVTKDDHIDTSNPATTEKIWNALFINIFIVNFTMNFGQFMMNTLIPKYADFLGASATTIGLIASVFTITALAIKPISGPAIDSFPKKKVLFGATLIITLAYITYSLARSVPMLIVARLIHGIGMGFTASACLAIASDSLPKSKMSQGIGYFSLGQAIASAIGPSLGLSISERYGYNITFAIGAGIIAVSAVLAIAMKTPQPQSHKPFVMSLNNMFAKEAIVPAVLQLFLTMAYAAIGSFLVLYAQDERGVANIGLWYTVNAGFMLITRPLIGKLADRHGIHKVMLPSLVLFGISLFIISVSDNIYMFLFSAFISACGYGTILPTIQTLCMKAVTPDRRGVAGNTNYIGADVGFMFGPILAGVCVTNFGYSNMFRIMILPIVIAIILFIVFYQKIKAISV